MLRFVPVVVVAVTVVACSRQDPADVCLTPTQKACTPDLGAWLTVAQLRADCAEGEACITDGADGGYCMPDTLSRSGQPKVRIFSGQCNGCGVCQFSCGGFAGYACPSNCVADGPEPGCCDQLSGCTVRP